MAQFYSDPERENEPHTLPDCEVFYVDAKEVAKAHRELGVDAYWSEPGWYWWACFPGCLPDGDASGPFESEQAAIEDAQNN